MAVGVRDGDPSTDKPDSFPTEVASPGLTGYEGSPVMAEARHSL